MMSRLIHLHNLNAADGADTAMQGAAGLLIPSHLCNAISVSVADIPRRFLGQALPSLLEEWLVEDPSALHIVQGQPHANGELAVLVTQHQRMQEWLDAAQVCGVSPRIICPDFYALPEHGLHLYIHDDYAIARLGPHSGISGDVERVIDLLMRLPASHLRVISDRADAVIRLQDGPHELSLVESSESLSQLYGHPINLLQGNYAVKHSDATQWRPLAFLAAALILVILMVTVYGRVLGGYYLRQNQQLQTALIQSQQALLGSEVDVAGFDYAVRVADTYRLTGGEPSWHLLRQVNQVLSGCRSCVVETLTVDDTRLLLTVREEGSADLSGLLARNPQLKIGSQQVREKLRVIELNWVKPS